MHYNVNIKCYNMWVDNTLSLIINEKDLIIQICPAVEDIIDALLSAK